MQLISFMFVGDKVFMEVIFYQEIINLGFLCTLIHCIAGTSLKILQVRLLMCLLFMMVLYWRVSYDRENKVFIILAFTLKDKNIKFQLIELLEEY